MTAQRKDHLDAIAVVALVGCCFIWGFGQVAAKVALADVPDEDSLIIR